MKVNLHAHTVRCNHASGTEREYIENAVKAGFTRYGFADHAPYVFRDGYYSNFRMKPEQQEDYVNTLLALKEEYRSGEKFDLTPEEIKQKTYLMVTATGDFVVVNAEGESFSNVGGYALGTMPVYGIDFMTGGSPVPYCFLVDHSASFTCIATEEDSSIMEFLASGEKASGYISADKEEDGWTKITFDDQEHIFKEP